MRGMSIHIENVGIAVRDLEEAIAFFTDLGLTVLGTDTVQGEWASTAVGLDDDHARIALLGVPDGSGQLELFEYLHPEAIENAPTQPHEIGMHRVAFRVEDLDAALEIAARHGCHPLRGVATYEDVYRLTYLRGPSGILVMLAEQLGGTGDRAGGPAAGRGDRRSGRRDAVRRAIGLVGPQALAGVQPSAGPSRVAMSVRICT